MERVDRFSSKHVSADAHQSRLERVAERCRSEPEPAGLGLRLFLGWTGFPLAAIYYSNSTWRRRGLTPPAISASEAGSGRARSSGNGPEDVCLGCFRRWARCFQKVSLSDEGLWSSSILEHHNQQMLPRSSLPEDHGKVFVLDSSPSSPPPQLVQVIYDVLGIPRSALGCTSTLGQRQETHHSRSSHSESGVQSSGIIDERVS